MAEPTIICPNCKTEIKLNESLAGPLIEATRKQFEEKLKNDRTRIAEEEAKKAKLAAATDLDQIRSSCVDHIFTDPPYSWKVQYGELNFIWEVWLGFDTHWHAEEIIVNETREKSEEDWANMMRKSIAECYRVLKRGRWLSLCYHDTSEGTWSVIQDLMAESGFIVDTAESALFIDTEQKSWKQLVADKVNKRDLVINFRKPKPGEIGRAHV